jgi:hypothetical protein
MDPIVLMRIIRYGMAAAGRYAPSSPGYPTGPDRWPGC